MTVHRDKFLIIKPTRCSSFSNLFLEWNSACFGQFPCPSSGVFHWSWSCLRAVSKPVWHIPLLCVQWKTPDDGQRNCLKHVQFHSKNKFEKLLHLAGFIIRNCLKTSSLVCLFLISNRYKRHIPFVYDGSAFISSIMFCLGCTSIQGYS